MPSSSAAARATAIDTASVAFAPSFDLFGVPSSAFIVSSRKTWFTASKPTIAGAMIRST